MTKNEIETIARGLAENINCYNPTPRECQSIVYALSRIFRQQQHHKPAVIISQKPDSKN